MDAMKKLNSIIRKIALLSEDDIREVEDIIFKQKTYIHPLKNATANRLHEAGNHNEVILKNIKEIRVAINLISGGD